MRSLILCFTLIACSPNLQTLEMKDRFVPQTSNEITFVSNLFNRIQASSIYSKSEYCGLIGVGSNGQLIATTPRMGNSDSCLPPSPEWQKMHVIASYHTHGAADLAYFTEIPSFDDMRTDIEDNTDGYIATPGGRLWYVDAHARIARELCGVGCLIADPAYVDDPDIKLQKSYTLKELSKF